MPRTDATRLLCAARKLGGAARTCGAIIVMLWLASAAAAKASGTANSDLLFADDAAVRELARQQLTRLGAPAIPNLDPRSTGCQDEVAAPGKCRNYDLFLVEAVRILADVSAVEVRTRANLRPARDLLWSLLFDPAADPFDLSRSTNWSRTDGHALRRKAQRALSAAMSLPARPSRTAASAAAAASASDAHHAWYILRACAGTSTLTGCRYGSYLFAANEHPVSARFIEVNADDNPGAGLDELRLVLQPGQTLPRLGVLFTRGGFGGDIDRIILHSLGVRQRALCSVSSPSSSQPLAIGPYQELVRFEQGACRWNALPPGATTVDFAKASRPNVPDVPPTPRSPAPLPHNQ